MENSSDSSPARPKVSIVVASHNASAVITHCLCAILPQARQVGAEVIVADSSADNTPDIVRSQFPEARLLSFSEQLNVPQLRGHGIAAARGEIIAIVDPYSIVDDDWLATLIRAHAARPEPAIGGAVELYGPSEQGLAAWATYLYEYGTFMLPCQAGPVSLLPGSNISYKRAGLPAANDDSLQRSGFWKTFVNSQMEAGGQQLWLAPGMVVRLWKPIPIGEFIRSRFDHGRCYAAMRAAEWSWSRRWLRALAAPLMPAVFLWRLTRSFWPKRRRRGEFLLAVPLICALFANWALGELWGYWRGAGGSCERLFY